jgi:hypothetical protein
MSKFYSYDYDPEILRADKIELYCRWLYQTALADGKPRVLVLYYRIDVDYSRISLCIDRLKKVKSYTLRHKYLLIQDFLMATVPVTFFIRISLPEDFQLQEDICLENGKTNEKLQTKTEVVNLPAWKDKEVVLLISRYPLSSTKKWIVANKKEVSNLDFQATDRTICLPEELKVVAI